jgi:hypothetical protein
MFHLARVASRERENLVSLQCSGLHGRLLTTEQDVTKEHRRGLRAKYHARCQYRARND